MRYAHTNIIANDWKSLSQFYIQVFECTILPPVRNQSGAWLSVGTGVANAHLQGVHLLLPGHGPDGPTLEIYQYAMIIPSNPMAPNQRGYGHLAFEVENVDHTLTQIIENGGSSIGTVTTKIIAGVGEITFVYARDPEGNILEIQHWDRSKMI